MPKRSAGLLVWRRRSVIEVLLVHPGGPFFRFIDDGVWSIPKGEYAPDEDPLEAARREFTEETGWAPPDGDYQALGEVRQRAGKIVIAWAVAGDFDPATLVSNPTPHGWPECDRAAWMNLAAARRRITSGQDELLHRLELRLA